MWIQGIFISHSSATADKNNAVDAPISKNIILILSMDWYNKVNKKGKLQNGF
jgi:hypothetical protein